eukprot:TRINITY_DN1836_c0_g1_i2.p1 TRINITY_DN1836_c0_g1~~TRINITY_DN1836_c0_g1_i2.p1  ORF type:complete len:299 (-),score=107.80 TRINITY_DN1836_c0_g1_i2:958-1797(-)
MKTSLFCFNPLPDTVGDGLLQKIEVPSWEALVPSQLQPKTGYFVQPCLEDIIRKRVKKVERGPENGVSEIIEKDVDVTAASPTGSGLPERELQRDTSVSDVRLKGSKMGLRGTETGNFDEETHFLSAVSDVDDRHVFYVLGRIKEGECGILSKEEIRRRRELLEQQENEMDEEEIIDRAEEYRQKKEAGLLPVSRGRDEDLGEWIESVDETEHGDGGDGGESKTTEEIHSEVEGEGVENYADHRDDDEDPPEETTEEEGAKKNTSSFIHMEPVQYGASK